MRKQYYAQIEWQDDVPVSKIFSDVYFSKASGLEESKYVFLQHNQLKERFSNLKNHQNFVIAETGFGSGLNFLATIKLWRETVKAPSARLHFISIEKYPLIIEDLQKILAFFPELATEANELITQYNLILPCYHRLSFANNVELTLIIGDINDKLAELGISVDAWFLDGFSPSKNAEMWNQTIFGHIARLSRQGTTFATFTASSEVQRKLRETGFNVLKDKGFAYKREMIYGNYNGNDNQAATARSIADKPWYKRDFLSHNLNRQVAIIGAGISGAATAYSLAKRGYQVTIFEANERPALEASGNYQGMLYGTWSAFGGEMMELSLSGYRYSYNLIKKLLKPQDEYEQCGLVQLAYNQQQQIRQQQLLDAMFPEDFFRYVGNRDIEALAGEKLGMELTGLYFPHGLWINPPSLVNALLSHPNISLITNCHITNFEQIENQMWQLSSRNGSIFHSKYLVLCNAHQVNNFEQFSSLPLRKIKGQISIAEESSKLATILCGKGYITPNRYNKFTLGATFKFNNDDLTINNEEHAENLANFKELLPNVIDKLQIGSLRGQANFRTSPHDYFPVVGPVADLAEFCMAYSKLRHDANFKITTKCPNYENLYLNLGHGAKGILTAPACGEIIADYIDNTPIAISESLRIALHPNRLYLRDLIKNKIK